MSRRHEELLTRALADLPREVASAGFTSRVLARLDDKRRRRTLWLPVRVALAGAAVVTLLLVALQGDRPQPEAPPQEELAARAEAIRQEHRLLREELLALQALADEAAPVLYLGRQDEFDVVLDLRPLMLERSGTRALPAVYRDPTGEIRPRFEKEEIPQ